MNPPALVWVSPGCWMLTTRYEEEGRPAPSRPILWGRVPLPVAWVLRCFLPVLDLNRPANPLVLSRDT